MNYQIKVDFFTHLLNGSGMGRDTFHLTQFQPDMKPVRARSIARSNSNLYGSGLVILLSY